MTRALLRRAVIVSRSPFRNREQRKVHARKWIAAVHRLGDKWLLAKPIQRGQS